MLGMNKQLKTLFRRMLQSRLGEKGNRDVAKEAKCLPGGQFRLDLTTGTLRHWGQAASPPLPSPGAGLGCADISGHVCVLGALSTKWP